MICPTYKICTKISSASTFVVCSHWKASVVIRPNKKIPVFRVTGPYLNLLVKPRIFSCFLEKKNILPFKMHNIIFFQKKK